MLKRTPYMRKRAHGTFGHSLVRSSAVALFLVVVSRASATIFVDPFSSGINGAHWNVISNQPQYTVDDTNGDIRFSRAAGGSQGFQYIGLDFLHDVAGDFDVSVRFRDASIRRINGTPGNQIQLNAIFGSQYFAVVRSDEVGLGNNVHVYRDPPQAVAGTQGTTATSGLLRITRTGSLVRGFFNSTQLYSANFNNSDVSRIWLSLQNNGTNDATSVTFDDFALTGGEINGVPEPQSWLILASGLAVFGGLRYHRRRPR
jgi:hypothetical protein